MRSVECEVEEERAFLVAFDEPNGLIRQRVGDVALQCLRLPVPLARRIEVAVPVTQPEADELVEAGGVRDVRVVLTEVPLVR
jgi:hypothetical protein